MSKFFGQIKNFFERQTENFRVLLATMVLNTSIKTMTASRALFWRLKMSVYYVFHEGEKRIISELASSNAFISTTVFIAYISMKLIL
jgi:hypothetical protein